MNFRDTENGTGAALPSRTSHLKTVLIGICILAIGVIYMGLDASMKVVTYTVETPKVKAPIRLALIADLHSCYYGEGQRDLINALEPLHPDAVVMAGDIVDDALPADNAYILLDALEGNYPLYYVTGNHEVWTGGAQLTEIIRTFEAHGVAVLDGDTLPFTGASGETIHIAGIRDPDDGGRRRFLETLSTLNSKTAQTPGTYTVLLSHRPEYAETYAEQAFDLVLCGHAHGGQWRIPGLINGVFAPNQGLLPKYAGGRYDFDHQTLIVSRGLARESTRVPRFFNRPELVIIDIVPSAGS